MSAVRREVCIARASALPLRPGSGVFPAVHEPEGVAANDPAEVSQPASEPPDSGARLRSKRRAAMRDELAPQLEVAMDLAGLSDCDIAAAIDEAPQRVAGMRAKRLPMTTEHLALLARSRDVRTMQVAEHLLRQIRGGR